MPASGCSSVCFRDSRRSSTMPANGVQESCTNTNRNNSFLYFLPKILVDMKITQNRNPVEGAGAMSGNWFSGSLGYGSGNLAVEKGDKGANEKEASLPGQFTLGSHINQMFMVDAISKLTNNLINHKSTN